MNRGWAQLIIVSLSVTALSVAKASCIDAFCEHLESADLHLIQHTVRAAVTRQKLTDSKQSNVTANAPNTTINSGDLWKGMMYTKKHPRVCTGIPPGTFIESYTLATALSMFGFLLMIGVFLSLSWFAHSRAATARQESGQVARKAPEPHLAALDGMRTLLTVYVIFYHERSVMEVLAPYTKPIWAGSIVRGMMQFFFVLSGFVSQISTEQTVRRFDTAQATGFFVKRLARLAPMYYLALFACLALGGASMLTQIDPCPFDEFPVQSVFLQPLVTEGDQHDVLYKANVVGWFVSTLLIASAFFPLLYNIMPSQTWKIILCLIGSIFARCYGTRLIVDLKLISIDPYVWPFFRIPELFAGMLAAKLCGPLKKAVPSSRIWGWLFDLSLLCSIPSSRNPELLFGSLSTGDDGLTPIWCWTCIAARLMLQENEESSGEFSPASGILSRILSSTPMSYFGDCSYHAYILQVPVKTIFYSIGFQLNSADLMWVLVGPTVGPIIVGWLASKFVDPPIQRFLRRAVETTSK
jgi:peptidoglycan/LPS O-acetylase OafA/YrhL